MRKCLLFLALILSFVFAKGQSQYDSLKKVFSARNIFEQRQSGNEQQFVKRELKKIDNTETHQLAICAVVENLFGFGWVDEDKLLVMVDDVLDHPASDNVKDIAQRVKNEAIRTLINTKIASITLPSVSGDSIRLTDLYTKRAYTVVDLWATWCGPCIAEMKKFNDLRKQYPTLEFYSISLDEDFERVKKFVSRNPDYTWPIVWTGKNSPLSVYFKARLIPAFVIVDRNGTIVSHIVGKGLEDELKKVYKK